MHSDGSAPTLEHPTMSMRTSHAVFAEFECLWELLDFPSHQRRLKRACVTRALFETCRVSHELVKFVPCQSTGWAVGCVCGHVTPKPCLLSYSPVLPLLCHLVREVAPVLCTCIQQYLMIVSDLSCAARLHVLIVIGSDARLKLSGRALRAS